MDGKKKKYPCVSKKKNRTRVEVMKRNRLISSTTTTARQPMSNITNTCPENDVLPCDRKNEPESSAESPETKDLGAASHPKNENSTMWQYHIGKTVPYSELFNFMEQLKQKHPRLVEDYSITESTLEEVFLSIAREQQQLQETERQQNLAGKQTEGEGPSKDVGQMKK